MAGTDEDPLSPRKRLKFLCSFGGKILPRPSDGQLKYVGGDTRVVVVHRAVTFSELMKKIRSMFDAEVVLKYQLMPEELDALVSVTCDEDLRHMVEEYDHHEPRSPTPSYGKPRLRVFLFAANQVLQHVGAHHQQQHHHHHHHQHNPLEQRYIDAINGVVRSPTSAANHRSIFTVSSANSSPYSSTTELNCDAFGLPSGSIGRDNSEMHRAHSSPNLNALSQPHVHRQQQQPLSRMHSLHAAGPGHGLRGYHVSQAHPAPSRRYYNSPAISSSGGNGPRRGSGGCVCCGHMDDGCMRRSGEHTFPAAPLKPVWE